MFSDSETALDSLIYLITPPDIGLLDNRLFSHSPVYADSESHTSILVPPTPPVSWPRSLLIAARLEWESSDYDASRLLGGWSCTRLGDDNHLT
jgi:hypothetical protein